MLLLTAAACADVGLKWLWAHTHGCCCKLAGRDVCWRVPSSSSPLWNLHMSAAAFASAPPPVCKMEMCCSAEFAALLIVIRGTNWPALWWQASTCEVPADLFLLFVFLGDFSGQLLAYLSLGPIFIIVGFVTLIIFKRELHTVSPSFPSQLLLMTKVFFFVTWCFCVYSSFSVYKEQAQVRWSSCQRTAGDLSPYQLSPVPG